MPKPKPEAPTVFKAASKAAAVIEGSASVQDAIDALVLRCDKLQPDLALPQDVLAAKAEIDALAKKLCDAQDALKAKIADHIQAGGKVERGDLSVNVSTQKRVTVPWSDIAVDMAQALAVEKGEKFSKDAWCDKMKASLGKENTITIVKITRADG